MARYTIKLANRFSDLLFKNIYREDLPYENKIVHQLQNGGLVT